jgi:hypothetical protein
MPTLFTVTRQPDGTRQFAFATVTPPADINGWRIRYSLVATADWNAMAPLHTGELKASPFETNLLAAGTYTFAIKTVDRAGNESAAALFIAAITLGDPRIPGVIDDLIEEPLWIGTKVDCHIN